MRRRMGEMRKPAEDFQIVPETKIGALLERFPQLEKTLMEMAPRFKQLRNPILRKTIARVASLSQVAAIGKVSLTEMINELRAQAGIQEKFAPELDADVVSSEKPAWVSESRIVKTLDARPLLEAGEHPVQQVLNECKDLKPYEIYVLITPFLPAPLIENAKKQGLLAWATEKEKGVFKTHFTRKD